MSEQRNIIREALNDREVYERVREWAAELRRKDAIVKKQADRFHLLSNERKTEVLQKFYEKYKSKKHWEVRCSSVTRLWGEFTEMLLVYGRKYKTPFHIDGYILPHECYKVHEGFYILDSVWVFLWTDKEITEVKENQSEKETLENFVEL